MYRILQRRHDDGVGIKGKRVSLSRLSSPTIWYGRAVGGPGRRCHPEQPTCAETVEAGRMCAIFLVRGGPLDPREIGGKLETLPGRHVCSFFSPAAG